VLESLFKPRTLRSILARHLAAPLLQEREAFLSHLHRQGTKRSNLLRYAPILIQINRCLGLTSLRDVSLHEVLEAMKRRRRQRGLRAFAKREENRRHYFTWLAIKWLRFHGSLKLPPRPTEPYAAELKAFAEFLRYRGLKPETIEGRCRNVIRFLRWFTRKHRSFRSIRVNDVDRFLSFERASGLAPLTSVTSASALRSFFTYAANHRWCTRRLGLGIERPSVPRPRFVRHGPDWREIRRVLRQVPTRPADRRAHAILSVLAVYALRASEVTRLLLADVDLRRRILSVRRLKRGCSQRFLIPQEVADALSHYISKTRPQCSCPNVFVTLCPPFRPIPSASIWKIINARLGRLGIRRRPCGARSIRHACATYLLKRGSSLKEVGDFLGHRDIRSTSTYAKCDMRALRAVADFDLGSLK
jgi:integrase/recombinase XerD